MTQQEIEAMNQYLAAGGKVIATGPSPLPQCKNSWVLSNQAPVDPVGFFSTIRDGVWHQPARWLNLPQPECPDPDSWSEENGLYYNPMRIENIQEAVLELCKKHCKPLPISVLRSNGYLIAMYESHDAITVHLLAADYDTDIDHHLDEIRFHRSRVNYINKVTPIGIDRTIQIQANNKPMVYTPFSKENCSIETTNNVHTITLPEETAYCLIQIAK